MFAVNAEAVYSIVSTCHKKGNKEKNMLKVSARIFAEFSQLLQLLLLLGVYSRCVCVRVCGGGGVGEYSLPYSVP